MAVVLHLNHSFDPADDGEQRLLTAIGYSAHRKRLVRLDPFRDAVDVEQFVPCQPKRRRQLTFLELDGQNARADEVAAELDSGKIKALILVCA